MFDVIDQLAVAFGSVLAVCLPALVILIYILLKNRQLQESAHRRKPGAKRYSRNGAEGNGNLQAGGSIQQNTYYTPGVVPPVRMTPNEQHLIDTINILTAQVEDLKRDKERVQRQKDKVERKLERMEEVNSGLMNDLIECQWGKQVGYGKSA